MGRWTGLAQWVGPTVNQGGPMSRHNGVVLHIAAGYFEGTISWQRNPAADVSSHFIVSKAGRIAQMVDTDVTAWTQRDGNGEWLSVENEGFLPDALTAAQVEANARILARAHVEYGVPLQVTDTPARRGLGHHSMGAENGVNWGHPQCPGPAIKAQKPAIVARAIQIVNGDDVTLEELMEHRIRSAALGKDATVADLLKQGWELKAKSVPELATQVQALSTQVATVASAVQELAARPDPGTVVISDEQLERVLRRIYGSVDGAVPPEQG